MAIYYKVPVITVDGVRQANMVYEKNHANYVIDVNDFFYMRYPSEEDVFPNEHFIQITEEEFEQIKAENVHEAPKPVQEYQPSNAEVAQMISDLQADLIINGVI